MKAKRLRVLCACLGAAASACGDDASEAPGAADVTGGAGADSNALSDGPPMDTGEPGAGTSTGGDATTAAGSGGDGSDGSSSGGPGDSDELESFWDPDGTVIYADQATMPQIEAASPGDVLLFEPGEHDRIDIDGFVSSECDPLVLVSLDPDNPAIIRNTTNPGWETLGVANSSYVVIENLILEGGISGIRIEESDHAIITRSEIRLTNHAGLNINTASAHVDFIGNSIHDTGQSEPKWGEGIYVGSAQAQQKDGPDVTTHVWIENNEIYETGYGEAVDLKGGVRHTTVRGNHIHDIRLGIENDQTNEAAIVMGFESSEPAENWVEFNLVEDVSWGGGGEDARPNVGASGIAAFGGGNYLHHNTVRNVLEYGVFFHGYMDPGFFVREWDNTVENAGYEDFRDGGLIDLTRSDPGFSNPNARQQWCAG
ncbi:MAG: right-handed parallel beta-helix repeat-containing protein [Myxococcota bacterium]